MTNRPWSLILLALFHFITPILSFIVNCHYLHLSVFQLFAVIWHEGFRQTLEFFFLPVLAGYSIYKMKKWSYAVFLATILWVAISNYVAWSSSKLYPIWLLISLYGFDFVLVSYFLLPQVRKTYFDPRVRWWENYPRYWIQSATKVILMERPVDGEIDNVSAGGAFLLTKENLEMGDCVRLQFKVLTNTYDINAEVVHKGKHSEGYGMRFVHTPETLEAMERLSKAMDILRVPRRPEYTSAWVRFKTWFLKLIKTGKGILPEVPETFGQQSKK